ncbi:CPBP family intramembrane glutamic endopeptidase [Mycolicibacterium pyrenivorans]|uniref:CPBP family intramembrane glutamic endopeptidase n=1 Tax=Mycolicibacterium pyrenivorans TaxID=187102 RepID=UPI0021F2B57A|nr:CPBP family intramembrane glutamic endopeptidase [Mycolicibacterium pyrenivorans]MCV7151096.1 CPBP family intramembrane metalloprotease [Mycolicibacterium pyrenivorans]
MDAALQSRPHRWGLGAFLLAEVVYLLTSLALAVLFGGQQVVSVSTVVLVVALPTLLAAAVAILASKVRGNGPRTDLRLQWSWRSAGLGVLFGLGGLFVTLPAAALWLSVVGEEANSAAGAVFGGVRGTWAWAVVVFVVIVFVAPVCEEIVYRGLLWDAVDRRWGRRVALLVTTVVFAIAHLELTRIPLLLVVALPIGLARFFVGDLTASILAHQVTNLLPGLVLMLTVAGAIPPA